MPLNRVFLLKLLRCMVFHWVHMHVPYKLNIYRLQSTKYGSNLEAVKSSVETNQKAAQPET